VLWEEERRRRAAAWREGEREVEGAPRRRNNLVECEDEEKEEKPSTSKKKPSPPSLPSHLPDDVERLEDAPGRHAKHERAHQRLEEEGRVVLGRDRGRQNLDLFFFSDSTENVGGCESATHLHLLLCSFFQAASRATPKTESKRLLNMIKRKEQNVSHLIAALRGCRSAQAAGVARGVGVVVVDVRRWRRGATTVRCCHRDRRWSRASDAGRHRASFRQGRAQRHGTHRLRLFWRKVWRGKGSGKEGREEGKRGFYFFSRWWCPLWKK
jgi:hypothetical protein